MGLSLIRRMPFFLLFHILLHYLPVKESANVSEVSETLLTDTETQHQGQFPPLRVQLFNVVVPFMTL